MKNYFNLVFKMSATLILSGSMLLFVACTGPAGPAGKDGTAINGACTDCHNASTELLAKIDQYNNSVHATGGNSERATNPCAACHTNEGFIERIASGADSVVATIINPTQQSCRTCHLIHTTYTKADLQLRTKTPVKLWINGKTIDFGEGNLCANCHQPRIPSPLPTIGGPDVKITSSYWGVHHGPQAGVIAGMGGYEIAGSTPYTNSPHKDLVTNVCITCHMQDPYGVQAGGHTLNMTYNSHGKEKDLVAVCKKCHGSNVKDFDIDGVQTEVEDLLTQLKAKLVAKGVVNEASGSIIPGTYSSLLAGTYLNYQMIEEDRSMGVHNAKYILALLNNSIEALQ